MAVERMDGESAWEEAADTVNELRLHFFNGPSEQRAQQAAEREAEALREALAVLEEARRDNARRFEVDAAERAVEVALRRFSDSRDYYQAVKVTTKALRGLADSVNGGLTDGPA